MAAIPPAAAAASTFTLTQAASFVAQIGASYLLGRLTAQDGPRLDNLQAAGGDYGIAMPRLYGEAVRATGIFIAQAKIKETKHKIEDYSELAGAATGASLGFMVGGPVGAAIGAGVGALLGAAIPDKYYYTYSDTFAVMLADRKDDDPIVGIEKMWANGKVLWTLAGSTLLSEVLDGTQLVSRKYGKNRWFKSLTIYGGGAVQTADPILNDKVGAQPGYRRIAYAVVEDLQLAPFGQSVPPSEWLVATKLGQSLADTVEAMCAAANVDPVHNMSSTALTGTTIKGYAITSETSCWDAIKPLLPVFRVDVSEVGGQLQFYRRGKGLRATIPPEDMAGHVYGDDRPERIRFSRSTDIDLPQETSFTFVDPARDYQANTASSKRSEGDAKSNISISIPLTLTADEGATAAATMHWDAWLGRTGAMFSLTDQWIGISPGVAYGIDVAGTVLPFRLTRKTRGANGIIECEVVSDESVTFQGVVAGSSGNIPEEESTDFADTRVVLMDMPILEDSHDDFGFYAIMIADEAYWTRGRIEASGNGGTNWGTLLDWPGSAIGGDVTGTLAAGTTDGLDDALDTVTVLTVVLEHDGMELASTTDTLLDAYENFAFVGKDGLGEYLQFKTATKIDTATWELTDLRRGRKGTDFAIGTHAAGEEFVLLGGDGVFRIPYADASYWGNLLNFRGVTLHQDEADATIVDFTNTGEGKRPYSPVNVEGTWDVSNNLTVSCDLRSRLNVGGLGIDDNDETDWEFFGGTGHSESVAGDTVTFSAAEQTAAGLTPGDTATGRVRQTSDVNDGRWRNFTIIGPNDGMFLEDDITPLELEDSSDFELE